MPADGKFSLGFAAMMDGEALQSAGSGRIEPLMLDVTNPEQIADAARCVGECVGGIGLHGLVNNAGIALGGPIETLAIEDLRAVLETNVVGQVAVTQAFLPLIRAVRGRVVSSARSMGASRSLPFSLCRLQARDRGDWRLLAGRDAAVRSEGVACRAGRD
jgi:NAD(P)-dependent dehydrogenase (short-subunit alcohol dehydrogenase family)